MMAKGRSGKLEDCGRIRWQHCSADAQGGQAMSLVSNRPLAALLHLSQWAVGKQTLHSPNRTRTCRGKDTLKSCLILPLNSKHRT